MGHNFDFGNPRLPFEVPVAGGLQPGASVDLRGRIDGHAADSFELNFRDEPDIAFHLKFRLRGSGLMVANSLEQGKWKKEVERTLQLHHGDFVHVTVTVQPEGYDVSAG